MGKNKQPKDQAPNPNSVPNREIFQRLNFLYQASVYLKGLETQATGHAPRDADKQPEGGRARKGGKKRRRGTLGELASNYVRCMRTICNKTVVRMDPSVKRTLCKGCDTVLMSGTTASVRTQGSRKGLKVAHTCLTCHISRAIPAPPVAVASDPADALDPSLPSMSTTSLQHTPEAIQGPPANPTQMPPQQHRGKWQRSRPLPLFARPDAGHVVFRGNDVLPESRE